jgi:uncharacterized protein (TIGR03067 family)
MKVRVLAVLGFILVLVPTVRSTDTEELRQLNGTWKLEMVTDLKKLHGTLTITKDGYTYEVGNYKETGTLHLHTDAKPKQMDLTVEKGSDRGKTRYCIYDISEGRLDFCTAKPGATRPTRFISDTRTGTIYWRSSPR